MTGLRLPTVACLLALSANAGAHPHAVVDQQALLSLGPGVADLTIRVVPSFVEGAAIFAHIDADSDGSVSEEERAAFALAVIERTRLEVDGISVGFDYVNAGIPGYRLAAAGAGVIEIVAAARFSLGDGGAHRVTFAIDYDDFSPDWQVQPYYYPDFVAAMSSPSVERTQGSNQVAIAFAAD